MLRGTKNEERSPQLQRSGTVIYYIMDSPSDNKSQSLSKVNTVLRDGDPQISWESDIRPDARVISIEALVTPHIKSVSVESTSIPSIDDQRCMGDYCEDTVAADCVHDSEGEDCQESTYQDEVYVPTLGYAQHVSNNTKRSVWFHLSDRVMSPRDVYASHGLPPVATSPNNNIYDSTLSSVSPRKWCRVGTTGGGLILRPRSSVIRKSPSSASIHNSERRGSIVRGRLLGLLGEVSGPPTKATGIIDAATVLAESSAYVPITASSTAHGALYGNALGDGDCNIHSRRLTHPLSDGDSRYDEEFIYRGYAQPCDYTIMELRNKCIIEEIDEKRAKKERLAVLNGNSTIIQSIARMWLARRRYLMHTRRLRETLMTTLANRHHRSAVAIQRYTRGMLCRRKYLRMRDSLWRRNTRASGGGVRALAAIANQPSALDVRRLRREVVPKKVGGTQATVPSGDSVVDKGRVKVPTVFPWRDKIVQRNVVFIEGMKALWEGRLKEAKDIFKSFSASKGTKGDILSLRLVHCIDARLEKENPTKGKQKGSVVSKRANNIMTAPGRIRGNRGGVSAVTRGVLPLQRGKTASVTSNKDRVLSNKRR